MRRLFMGRPGLALAGVGATSHLSLPIAAQDATPGSWKDTRSWAAGSP